MAVLYGDETWNMGAAERRILNAMKMKCLRRMHGVARMDTVKDEGVQRSGVV